MRLTSTLNPASTTEENIPVAIFRYNGQRKFLRLAEDYQGMIKLVLQAFKIDERPLSLQTSSLDACKGESVEIDESAYPLMCSVLDDINIISQGLVGVSDQQQYAGEGALLTPMRSTSEPSSPPPPHIDADTPPRSGTRQSLTSGPLPPSVEDEREAEQMDEFATVNETDVNREVFGFKGKGKDTRRWWTLQDNTVNKGEGTSGQQKFRPDLSPLAPTEADDNATPQVKKEKITTPTYPTRDPPQSSNHPHRDLNIITPSSSVDPESRFEVSILGPGPEQVAQFKTRGKHTVGKVLAAACKTFNIDVSRAHLCYIFSVADEDGETDPCKIECDVDETMAQFGGTANLELFIELDPPVGGEDDLMNFH